MVKFEFTLTDEEALELMNTMLAQIVSIQSLLVDEMVGKSRAHLIAHYRASIKQLKELKSKMKSRRVEDEETITEDVEHPE